MKIPTSPFIPMGPLRYLIMTKEGQPLLGLYTYQPTGETVIKVHYEKRVAYYWPTLLQMINLLENRVKVHKVLGEMRVTDKDLNPFSTVVSLILRVHNHLNFPGYIMNLEDVIVHPNFYYTYRGHLNTGHSLN